ENIVRGRKLAVNISAFAFQRRGPGLFYIQAMAAPDQSIEELEQAVYEEIETLKSGSIADWEIESAVSRARRQFIAPLSEALSRATLIGEYAVYYQKPGLINTRLEEMMPQITRENIQRVAKKYLIPGNRTVIITRPAQASAEKGGN
ncbi:MAG TPA: insulinase family protein, partial [Desulfobacteraceae bacterium]|nr:insulinase family protein [Desulfobacteraceae bacterium]